MKYKHFKQALLFKVGSELESQLIFYSDSESPIPAPMMLFIVGDAFEKYVSQQ